MLNKDEYNQDEYNDYYAQEIRGAEISSKKNSKSGKKLVFILLLLLIILALAYFGWKSISGSNSSITKIDKNDIALKDVSSEENKTIVEKKPIVKPIKKEPIVQKELTTTIQKDDIVKEVEKIASNQDDNLTINPKDIANIVQKVIQEMNKNKSKKSTKSNISTEPIKNSADHQTQDSKLIESLSNSEVDLLSNVSDDIEEDMIEKDKSKKASSSNTPDTYNKVVVDDKSAKNSDELSKLSDKLSSALNEEDLEKDNTDYTQSITKEVKTRKKEMRYIIVKKGDTLSKIAKKVYGNVMDYKKIYKANPDILRRPDRIYIGQKLRVPK